MRFHLRLYLLIAGLYLLTASGRIGLSDSVAMYNVAQSILFHGNLSSEPCDPNSVGQPNHCVLGTDGHYYAGFGLLPSILAGPSIFCADVAAKFLGVKPDLAKKLGVSLFTALIAPLVGVFLSVWILKLGLSRFTALCGALVITFASSNWHFGVKGFFSEPYFVLALVLSGCLLSFAEIASAPFFSGLAFGAACGCRVNGLILLPAFLLCIVFHARRRGYTTQRLLRDLALFGFALSICIGLIAWANFARFGSPLKTGYHLVYPSLSALLSNPLLAGMRDLILSPEIGLLFFAPWFLLALVWIPRFSKAHPGEAVLCVGVFVISLLFFAKYESWHGGWVAGPRFLLPALPFLVLPLAFQFEEVRMSHSGPAAHPTHRGFKPLLIGLVAFAFLTQLAGLPYPDERYYIMYKCFEGQLHKPRSASSFSVAVLQFDFSRSPKDFWRSNPSRASSAALTDTLAAEQAACVSMQAGASADDALRLLPDSENVLLPNFLLVKLKWLGMPRFILYGYILVSIAIAASGLVGIIRFFRGPGS